MATVTRELQDNASKTSLGMVEPIYVEQGSNHLKWGIIFLCELTQIVLFTLVGSSDSSFHTITWPKQPTRPDILGFQSEMGLFPFFD